MTRPQEILIRSVAASLRAAADTLMSLLAREEPKTEELKCPECNSTNVAEALDDYVCADCNTNFGQYPIGPTKG